MTESIIKDCNFMKRILFIVALTTAVMTMSSCNKYDGYALSDAVRQNSKLMPPKSVTDDMPQEKLQIPENARDVEWEKEGSLWVLSYDYGRGEGRKEVDVYFDADGIWLMTKTDMSMKEVPQFIKEYVTSSDIYGTARFSDRDAELIETPSGNSYVFEVLLDMREIDIEVTEDGDITERFDR